MCLGPSIQSLSSTDIELGMKRMTHTVHCEMKPYIRDPDYQEAFLHSVKSTVGLPIEITSMGYGQVDVIATDVQVQRLLDLSMVKDVKTTYGDSMSTSRTYLVQADEERA